MILKNELYTVTGTNVTDTTAEYNLEMNAGHFIYKAHFPGQPITPGVCIVQIAKELLEDYVQKPLEIVKIKNVKFLSVITPDETTSVTYQLAKVAIDEDSHTVKVQATVSTQTEAKAKVSLVCCYSASPVAVQ